MRAAMAEQILDTIEVTAGLVAERVGRPADAFAVRTWAGAVIGAVFPLMSSVAQGPSADWVSLIDAAFAHLEAGLPL